MYGGQEKILGQKVNVKFFTVDPYVGGPDSHGPFQNLPIIGKILIRVVIWVHTVLLAGWWSSDDHHLIIWWSSMIIMMMIAMCVQTVWLAGWLSEESATSQLVGCSYIFPPVRLLMFFFFIFPLFLVPPLDWSPAHIYLYIPTCLSVCFTQRRWNWFEVLLCREKS